MQQPTLAKALNTALRIGQHPLAPLKNNGPDLFISALKQSATAMDQIVQRRIGADEQIPETQMRSHAM